MVEKFNFTVKGKTYTTSEVVVGKMIDLWRMRTAISMGSYGLIYRVGLDAADEALIIIDIEAFFTVFCPKFIEDLKPRTIREMGFEDYLELKEIYQSQIEPWLKKIESLLKKKKEDE
jgi:hypothetical protein